jgi:hypothetical protein
MGFNLNVVGDEAWPSLPGDFMGNRRRCPVICIICVEKREHRTGIPEDSAFH